MKIKRVCYPQKELADLIDFELNTELTGNNVLIKAEYSGISAGTELANYHGMPNTAGGLGHFPFYPGYSAVGHVVAIGPDVKTVKVGDRVMVHWAGHCSWFVRPENDLFPVHDDVSSEEAAFAHIASFPFLGVRKLRLELGESCMIAGCGILGLFAVQIAKLSGACPVLACDYSPERRAMAKQLGADFVFDPQEPDFVEKVKAATDGKGPNAVVEVTGYISALRQALLYIAREGRITLLGCTRVSDETIDFYKYVHLPGIKLIGCHTNTRPKVESEPGRWTEWDDYRTFMKFVANKRLQVKPFISKVVSPRDAKEVYHEIGTLKNPPFGILFDWRDIDADLQP